MTSKETPWEPRTWNWTERGGTDESPEQLALKRPRLGCSISRSKGRHRIQGRRNTFKEALVGDTGDKADGTLVVLDCSHPRSEYSWEAKNAAQAEVQRSTAARPQRTLNNN